jgi:hypothetical protein
MKQLSLSEIEARVERLGPDVCVRKFIAADGSIGASLQYAEIKDVGVLKSACAYGRSYGGALRKLWRAITEPGTVIVYRAYSRNRREASWNKATDDWCAPGRVGERYVQPFGKLYSPRQRRELAEDGVRVREDGAFVVETQLGFADLIVLKRAISALKRNRDDARGADFVEVSVDHVQDAENVLDDALVRFGRAEGRIEKIGA